MAEENVQHVPIHHMQYQKQSYTRLSLTPYRFEEVELHNKMQIICMKVGGGCKA